MMGVKAILLFGALFVAGMGAVVHSLWGPRARARKRLDRGQTALEDGAIVTLTGVVRAIGDTLVAPLSGKPCVLYDASGRIMGASGRVDDVIANIHERNMLPFELVTADGVVRVDGESADTDLPEFPLIPRKLEREIAFMSAHEQSPEYVRHSSFYELRLEVGMKIRVQGRVVVELDPTAPEGGYRDGSRKVRLVAHAGHPLTIGRAR